MCGKHEADVTAALTKASVPSCPLFFVNRGLCRYFRIVIMLEIKMKYTRLLY